ncbi:hypothetical protein ACFFRR_006467 [Megaselia abdita]
MSKFAVIFAIFFVAVYAQGPVDPVTGYVNQITAALQERVATIPVDKQAAAQVAVDEAKIQIGLCEDTYRKSAIQAGPARGEFYQCSSLHYAHCHSVITALVTGAPVVA